METTNVPWFKILGDRYLNVFLFADGLHGIKLKILLHKNQVLNFIRFVNNTMFINYKNQNNEISRQETKGTKIIINNQMIKNIIIININIWELYCL